MTTVSTYCEFCNSYCGDISIFDIPYTGEPVCHDCNEAEDNAQLVADFAEVN